MGCMPEVATGLETHFFCRIRPYLLEIKRKKGILSFSDVRIAIEKIMFKEEKQLFGLGQAQVRRPPSVSTAPAVCIASYAGLRLAGLRVFGFNKTPLASSVPKWRNGKRHPRMTTGDLLRQLRHEAAARSLVRAHFSDFSFRLPPKEKPAQLPTPALQCSQRPAA